ELHNLGAIRGTHELVDSLDDPVVKPGFSLNVEIHATHAEMVVLDNIAPKTMKQPRGDHAGVQHIRRMVAFALEGAKSGQAQVCFQGKHGELWATYDEEPAAFPVVDDDHVIQTALDPLDDEFIGAGLQ